MNWIIPFKVYQILVLPYTSIHSSIRSKNRSDSILFLYYSGSVYLWNLSGFKCRLKEIFVDSMTANPTKIFLKLSSKQFRHRVFNRHQLFFKADFPFSEMIPNLTGMDQNPRSKKHVKIWMLKWALMILNNLEWPYTSTSFWNDWKLWNDL